MVMFENIEEIFQNLREFNEYSKAIVTLATAVGAIIIVIYTLKLVYNLAQGLRLYVFSQLCCRGDYKKRYGEWAVISGATDGIGQSMAKELARRGHSLIVIGRNEEKLARTKGSLEQEANVGEVVTVKIDLSDSSLENFARIRDQIDPDNRDIGILINNAGTYPDRYMRFNKYDMDYTRVLVNLNILSVLHLTRMIMPGMLDRGKGLVVNVSSAFGAFPVPYMNVYGASKTFVDAFSRQLQIEYSSHPIDIINLTTGPVYTHRIAQTYDSRSALFSPFPDDYARSAINALSTRINAFSGIFSHAVFITQFKLINALGLIPLALRIGFSSQTKDFKLSPITKKKNLATVEMA